MRRFFALFAALALLAVFLPQQASAHSQDPTQGGAGGRIIRVTTLAADGPGSLRAAIRSKGPRIIVFEV
ncbi:MAG: pectate lyase, partial [Allorhizobium sp.]